MSKPNLEYLKNSISYSLRGPYDEQFDVENNFICKTCGYHCLGCMDSSLKSIYGENK